MKKVIFGVLITLVIFCMGADFQESEKRDPFIPLVDEKGNLRKDFKKPIDEQMIPQVTLMGISKVNKVFYAIIDGEWVKEGDKFKDLKIEKIEPDKVILEFGERKFELKLEREKK